MLEKQEEFLVELSALSRKYRIKVDGCGCCGSPFLTEIGGKLGFGRYAGDEDGIFFQEDGDAEITIDGEVVPRPAGLIGGGDD